MTTQVLEFLGQNKKNVAAIHCLDGRSNTAMLFVSIILVARVFSSYREALALFEEKRGEPVLNFGQRNVLKQLEKALKSGNKDVELTKQPIHVSSVILEPVPLFTKANDGARPFVDVYCDGNLVATSFKDYNSLKLFTPYDGEAVIRTNIRVPPGDVTVMVYHARQSIAGSILSAAGSASTTKIKICQVYFNPATVSPTRTHVRFPTHEIDSLSNLDRIPADFAVSVNFQRKDPARTEKFPYVLPDRRKLDLVFATKGEHAEACAIAGVDGGADTQPKRPPREKHSPSPSSNMPKPSSLVDIASISETPAAHRPISDQLKEQKKPSSLIDIGGTASEDSEGKIVDNIFPEHPPTSNNKPDAQGSDILLDLGGSGHANKPPPASNKNEALGGSNDLGDLLGGFSAAPAPAPAPAPRVPQPGGGSSNDPTLLNDLFGGPSKPKVPQPMGGSSSAGQQNQQGPLLNDFFSAPPPPSANSGNVGDLFGQSGPPAGSNLLGDLLSPSGPPPAAPAAPKQSASEKMVDDMLNNLSVGGSASNNTAPKNTSSAAQAKPNYNSSFFQTSQNNNNNNGGGGMSKPPSQATFEDLLGGFTPSTDPNAGKSIGEMKKAEDKKVMTPQEAAIFEWTHGKSRNLRALLCSLDTVIWEGSRWEK